jgi:transcriptional regulator with XRE-family HTH domain
LDNPRNSPTESSLVEALKRRLAFSRISQREAERALGMGHGTIGKILRGRTVIRLAHVELLAPVLGFTMAEILSEALGQVLQADEDRFAKRVASHLANELLRRKQ